MVLDEETLEKFHGQNTEFGTQGGHAEIAKGFKQDINVRRCADHLVRALQ